MPHLVKDAGFSGGGAGLGDSGCVFVCVTPFPFLTAAFTAESFDVVTLTSTCMGEGKAPANSSNGVLIPEAKFTDVTCPRCNRGWPLYWAKISKFKKKQQIEEEK